MTCVLLLLLARCPCARLPLWGDAARPPWRHAHSLTPLRACFPPCSQIVRQIDMWGIDMVFVVGGNGGNAGAAAMQAELEKNNVVCSVVGVPKSIGEQASQRASTGAVGG